MNEQSLLDHIRIQDIISRYNILGDRGQVAEMAELFAPNARLRALDRSAVGREQIASMLNANPTTPRHTVTRHHLGTQCIDIDGDDASVRTYFMVHTNVGPDHHGVYVDKLARLDGRWVITDRDVRLDWQAPDSVYQPMPVHRR